MVLTKITWYVIRLFVIAAIACNVAYANTGTKMKGFDVPMMTHPEHSFLSIHVSQEPVNLFDPVSLAKINKSSSTKFFSSQKKLSSKIRIAEQHFINGSKAEYLLVVKRHSLFLKFQLND